MSDSNNESGKRRTLVEEETEFKGTLTSRCPVIVMGKLDGEIDAPSVHISSTGSVAGSVLVGELSSEGQLAGEVEAESVRLSGQIKDNTVIRAKTLEVRLARQHGKMEVVFGECELAVGDEPSKEAAIAAALAGESIRPEPPPAEEIAAAADDAQQERPAEAPSEEPDAAAASESDDEAPTTPEPEAAGVSGESPTAPDDWGMPDSAAADGEAPSSQRKHSRRRQRRESQQPPPA
jgi:cytoskeletal protein CcmA (bactofilin family)